MDSQVWVLLADSQVKFFMEMGGFLFLFAMLYLFLLRPAMNQEKEVQKQRQTIQNNLQKNDQILTSGGIYGTVVALAEGRDEVTIRVDDQVKIKVTKSGIIRNFTREASTETPAKTG